MPDAKILLFLNLMLNFLQYRLINLRNRSAPKKEKPINLRLGRTFLPWTMSGTVP
jgi:hypothetical protein